MTIPSNTIAADCSGGAAASGDCRRPARHGGWNKPSLPLLILALAVFGSCNDARDPVGPDTPEGSPTASFAVNGNRQAGGIVSFDARLSSDPTGGALTFSWDFGNGIRGGTEQIAHVYREAGDYDVRLVVTNSAGLSAALPVRVAVSAAAPATATNGVVTGLAMNAVGEPLSGVMVRAGGPASVTTGGDGRFILAGVDVGIPVVLSLVRDGYSVQRVRVNLPAAAPRAYIESRLLQRAAPTTIGSVEAGGTAAGQDGARITFPANALITGSGAPVTGTVSVSMTPVDVSGDQIAAFPGSFSGVTAEGTESLILSYGAAEFVVSQGGEKLDIAPGRMATIEVPVYTGGTIGEVIPLWSLDAGSGFWVQEGVGTLVASSNSPTGLAFRAQIGHLSWWNCDIRVARINPTIRPRDPDGNGVEATIRVTTVEGPAWRGQNTIPGAGAETTLPADLPLHFIGTADGGALVLDSIMTIPGMDVVLRFRPIPGVAVPATAVRYGESPKGTLRAGAVDRWKFDGLQGDLIRLQISASPGFSWNGVVELYDVDGSLIQQASFSTVEQVIFRELTSSGEFGIHVRAQSALDAGEYVLALDRHTQVTRNIAYGATETQYLYPGVTDHFNFAGTEGDLVRATFGWIAGGTRAAALLLIDPLGAVEGTLDLTTALVLNATLQSTGSYQLRIRSESSSSHGFYRIGLALKKEITLDDLHQPISAGSRSSCGLTATGAAYCWGSNADGLLGNPAFTTSRVPVPVVGDHQFTSISVGQNSTCAITLDGDAYCWGSNGFGRLGNPAAGTSSMVPFRVSGVTGFSSISAAPNFTCGLLTNGDAYCWGFNGSGQLGNGTTVNSPTPVAVFGGYQFTQLDAEGNSTCGVLVDGAALCWGNNADGELGNGTTQMTTIPTAVAGGLTFTTVGVGSDHSCGLDPSGQIHCWGSNNNGQVGNDSQTSTFLTPQLVSGGRSYRALSVGGGRTCAIEAAVHTGWCWGANQFRQLGDGTTTTRRAPVAVLNQTFSFINAGSSALHTCGLDLDRRAWCWGDNRDGQLGNGTITSSGQPVAVQNWLTLF